MLRKLFCILLLLIGIVSFSQDMQQGFDYLESGDYKRAEAFFFTVLEKYPDNKTARLCYGRAVGLSGDSGKAISIFTNLQKEYPNDFEIKLNYAESLLWDKQFAEALPYYKKLIGEDATSFAAVLGYANTLSNLKKYEEALDEVTKALRIHVDNPNALVSRKYIRLGYANQLVQSKGYEKALDLLDQNLVDFPNDRDTQLNRANIYLLTKNLDNATKVYTEMATNFKDSIRAMNGMALIFHKRHKDPMALEIATNAVTKIENNKEDTTLYLATKERYVQALLWNREFANAREVIEKLKVQFPGNTRILALSAASGMHTSDFKKSIKIYEQILAKDTSSFDGNLGIANGYRAVGNDMKAYEYAFKTLHFYPGQPDAESLIKVLKQSHTPFLEQKTAFTFDNGDNEAINISLGTEIPFSSRFRTKLEYTYRNTKNRVTKNEASSNEVGVRFSYKLYNNLLVEAKGGISKSNAFTNDYTQWTGELKIKTKPYKLQNLAIGYQRELQNFNADLIDREIVMNNYFLNYNLSTNINLGWYTQYMYTSQTDSNDRNLFFTSLYYTISRRPAVKTGVNYQYITFRNQVPTIYFSPEKFNVVEIFADMTSNQDSKWFYGANGAAGYQFIENDPGSTTFRIEGKMGYQISDRFILTLYGKYSNIASATASGFRFTEFGFLWKWYFLRQPIFNPHGGI